MPRGPRLDVADALYHVIARGVERRPIFRDDQDRRDFLRRLAVLSGEEEVRVFAFALMDNHFHLVVQRGQRPLGSLMRRLLTGYSGTFNRRHRRVGHLFQNRYQAVLCDANAYLLALVRYVHLNPVRAGVVADPLRYAWTSHAAYMRPHTPEWLETRTVLGMLGSRRAYRKFIADGVGQGRRPELSGVAAATAQHQQREGPQLWLGNQVLGTEQFARRLLRAARRREAEQEMEGGRAADLPELAEQTARRCGIAVELLRGRGRARAVSRARRALIDEAVRRRGVRPVELSRYLGISTAAVAQCLRALERQEEN